MPPDPYSALHVPQSATAAEIKQAYRKLARANHPDLHPDDPTAAARFKDISAAYDLLKNPATRARFDAGEIDASGAEKPPRPYYRDFAQAPGNAYRPQPGFGAAFGGEGDPADIFAEILRRRGRAGDGFAAPGRDLRFALEVPFLDAARGGTMHLTLGESGDLVVTIPQGAQDGQTLRLRGKGSPGFDGGPPGDALITLSLRPHPVFRREGATILITLPITIDEAILGATVSAPTISGAVSLKIPAGTSSGRVLRLRGRGVGRSDGTEFGDQLVELRIVAPPWTDAPLRAFMTESRSAPPHAPRSDLMAKAV